MIIYTAHKDAPGIDRFIMRVKGMGNAVTRNPDSDTGNYEIFSRFQDHVYKGKDITTICEEEIGAAVKEFEENEGAEKRPQSLADILNQRSQLDVEDEFGDNEDMTESNDEQDDPNLPDQEEDFQHAKADEEIMKDYDGEYVKEPYFLDPKVETAIPAIQKAAQTLSDTKKQRLLQYVHTLLNMEFVSDSDVLLALSETADIKKCLSALLAGLGTRIALTTVSKDYKVKPQDVLFISDKIETLEHYRRGTAQALLQVKEFADTMTQIQDLTKELREAQAALEIEKRMNEKKLEAADQTLRDTTARLTPRPILPARFIVFWVEEGNNRYLTVQKNARFAKNDDPAIKDYPSKYCGMTVRQGEAHKFTDLDSARAQAKRIIQFAKNCAFLNGSKPMLRVARLGFDIVSED